MASLDLPDTILRIDSAPHSWLLPRMAAVVHHGGMGTAAAGLRAGVPSMAVPFFGDQYFWGNKLAALGVGAKPINRERLSAENLATALQQMTFDKLMQRVAKAIGHQIRREDGVAQAVMLIERYLMK